MITHTYTLIGGSIWLRESDKGFQTVCSDRFKDDDILNFQRWQKGYKHLFVIKLYQYWQLR